MAVPPKTSSCPWGCNEFFHQTGSSPFDEVIAAALGRDGIAVIDKEASPRIEKIERFYLRYELMKGMRSKGY